MHIRPSGCWAAFVLSPTEAEKTNRLTASLLQIEEFWRDQNTHIDRMNDDTQPNATDSRRQDRKQPRTIGSREVGLCDWKNWMKRGESGSDCGGSSCGGWRVMALDRWLFWGRETCRTGRVEAICARALWRLTGDHGESGWRSGGQETSLSSVNQCTRVLGDRRMGVPVLEIDSSYSE
jgi:hypothetical protein